MNYRLKNHMLAVSLSVATLAVVTGCAGSDTESSTKPTRILPSPAVPFDEKDPSTWTLPIQGYLPSDSAKAQISQARKQLIGDCMKGFGFTWAPAPDLPKIGGKTLVDWRYGIHDLALAKVRGYKPDANDQAAYDNAINAGAVDNLTGGADSQTLDGSGVKAVNGKKVPEGGCMGQADRRIGAQAVQTNTAQEISAEAFVKSKADAHVVKAFGAWSACMKASGYNYAAPLDASDDPRFGSPDVTALEIATATTDIDCRNKTNVAKIWFDAETTLQNKAIENKAELLDHESKALDAAVKKAASVIAGTR
ncbi:hypothetical protein [Streptomyces beijiangensis]|uniref:Lipoprotein n=1 Tax=Streptomyces beijiangensis TaxID=163361 RepID=A0A939F3L9_9ACTN|nr:hypothetical protein [Streptomyces beijiangensis]MBO0511088.1 hypothetical protein [Streptomyces beijiangensis]